MSPLYNSQVATNSPLVAVEPDQAVPATLLSAETPVAGTSSLAVALSPRTPTGQLTPVRVRFNCPLGIGSGVFQIQTAQFDSDSEYTSEAFGGASPGVVNSTSLWSGASSSGVSAVELILRARFLRVKCTTAPSNPITVTVD